jgi:hypothetical protein
VNRVVREFEPNYATIRSAAHSAGPEEVAGTVPTAVVEITRVAGTEVIAVN